MRIIFLVFISKLIVFAQTDDLYRHIAGSAFLDNRSYAVLQRLCDEAGGRLAGTVQNEKALQLLTEELQKLGLQARRETFTMPGWFRGADSVVMTQPTPRRLNAVALGYVQSKPAFNADLVYAEAGFPESFKAADFKGKIALVNSQTPKGKEALMRSEIIRTAAAADAKAVLFINDRKGALSLAGTGSFTGVPTPIPAYSLTFEEGMWLKRLLDQSFAVKLTVDTRSFCREIKADNLAVTFPGELDEKIVLGAHLDSWDLSQGGLDNGIGSATLFEIARLIGAFHPCNRYTLELVWFNAEELGLFGSKAYMNAHHAEPIAAMINMDMPGSPTGFNAMGFDEFVPFLEQLVKDLNGFDLKTGVISSPWTNSDHVPFMLHGIRSITMNGHLDEEDVRYYHSAGDSFDKARKKYLSEAAAVLSILAVKLANQTQINFRRLSPQQSAELFIRYKLDDRLKRQGEWIFQTENVK
jgi:Iap family predicted aminopeptidase